MKLLNKLPIIFKSEKLTLNFAKRIIEKVEEESEFNLILDKIKHLTNLERKSLLIYLIELGKINFTILFQEKFEVDSSLIRTNKFISGLFKNNFYYIKNNYVHILKYLKYCQYKNEILEYLVIGGLFELAFYFKKENKLNILIKKENFWKGSTNFEKSFKGIKFDLNKELSKIDIYLNYICEVPKEIEPILKSILENNNEEFKLNIHNLESYQNNLIKKLNIEVKKN